MGIVFCRIRGPDVVLRQALAWTSIGSSGVAPLNPSINCQSKLFARSISSTAYLKIKQTRFYYFIFRTYYIFGLPFYYNELESTLECFAGPFGSKMAKLTFFLKNEILKVFYEISWTHLFYGGIWQIFYRSNGYNRAFSFATPQLHSKWFKRVVSYKGYYLSFGSN